MARDEVAAFAEYDFVVVNDELTAAVDRLRSIVVAERARLRAMRGEAETHSQDIFMIDRSKLPNSFEFVVTAGARARQLLAGSTPRVDGRRAQEDDRRAAGSHHEAVEKIERDERSH